MLQQKRTRLIGVLSAPKLSAMTGLLHATAKVCCTSDASRVLAARQIGICLDTHTILMAPVAAAFHTGALSLLTALHVLRYPTLLLSIVPHTQELTFHDLAPFGLLETCAACSHVTSQRWSFPLLHVLVFTVLTCCAYDVGK